MKLIERGRRICWLLGGTVYAYTNSATFGVCCIYKYMEERWAIVYLVWFLSTKAIFKQKCLPQSEFQFLNMYKVLFCLGGKSYLPATALTYLHLSDSLIPAPSRSKTPERWRNMVGTFWGERGRALQGWENMPQKRDIRQNDRGVGWHTKEMLATSQFCWGQLYRLSPCCIRINDISLQEGLF